MKPIKFRLIVFLLLLAGSFHNVISCDSKTVNSENSSVSIGQMYDSSLAKEYGADAYGMKTYVMAFLKSGPNRDMDSARAAELQTAHLNNIRRLAAEGKLILAGPFIEDGPLRGIYIFDVKTVEEAEALTNTDPAIQAGRLEMELKRWYGPAALMAVNRINEKLQRQSITGDQE